MKVAGPGRGIGGWEAKMEGAALLPVILCEGQERSRGWEACPSQPWNIRVTGRSGCCGHQGSMDSNLEVSDAGP